MNLLVPLYAAVGVMAIGWVAYWLATKLVGEAPGKIAAFSGTLGILIGNSAGVERSASDWLLNALGAIVGLIVLWWLLFRQGFQRG